MKFWLYSALVILVLVPLAIVDLVAGALLLFAPGLIAMILGVSPQEIAVPTEALWVSRAYAQRMAIVGLFLLVLVFMRDRARFLWLPALDEALNAGLVGYELLTANLSVAMARPLLLVHAAFALLLIILWGIRPREAAPAVSAPAAAPAMAKTTTVPRVEAPTVANTAPPAKGEEADIEAMLERTRRLTTEINRSEQEGR